MTNTLQSALPFGLVILLLCAALGGTLWATRDQPRVIRERKPTLAPIRDWWFVPIVLAVTFGVAFGLSTFGMRVLACEAVPR